MSCDFEAFPFFGAFAPCSDKQFKTKQNRKHSEGQSLSKASRPGISGDLTGPAGAQLGDGGPGQSETGTAMSPRILCTV